jgi:hypothetical protein
MLPEGFSMESYNEQRQYSSQGNNTIPTPQDQEVHRREHLKYLQNKNLEPLEEYLEKKLEKIKKLQTMQKKKNFLARLKKKTTESLFDDIKKKFTYAVGHETIATMRNEFFDPKNKNSKIVQDYECVKYYLDPDAATEYVGWLPDILCKPKESETFQESKRGIDIFKLLESSIDTNRFTTHMLHPLAELISDPKKRSIAKTKLYPEIKNKISVDKFKADISPFTEDHATSYTTEQKFYLTPEFLDDFFKD